MTTSAWFNITVTKIGAALGADIWKRAYDISSCLSSAVSWCVRWTEPWECFLSPCYLLWDLPYCGRPLQCRLFCHKHDTLLPWNSNPWLDVVCRCNGSISDQMLAFCHQPRIARPWNLLQPSLGSASALPVTLLHLSQPILRPGTVQRPFWRWGLALLTDATVLFHLWLHTPVYRATSHRGKPRTDTAPTNSATVSPSRCARLLKAKRCTITSSKWAVVSLNQIDNLLETLVGWLVWNYQVTGELVGFRSTRTKENGTLLGGCVNVIGSKVFLEALCVGHPVLVTLYKWPDRSICHHFSTSPSSPLCSICSEAIQTLAHVQTMIQQQHNQQWNKASLGKHCTRHVVPTTHAYNTHESTQTQATCTGYYSSVPWRCCGRSLGCLRLGDDEWQLTGAFLLLKVECRHSGKHLSSNVYVHECTKTNMSISLKLTQSILQHQCTCIYIPFLYYV